MDQPKGDENAWFKFNFSGGNKNLLPLGMICFEVYHPLHPQNYSLSRVPKACSGLSLRLRACCLLHLRIMSPSGKTMSRS